MNNLKRNFEIGEEVHGVVKNIKPYGAFIEIDGGTVGLAHIEDLSVARIKTPYERLKIGQEVELKVKNIDEQNGRISLSYKEMLGTWEENADKFHKGMFTKGIVRETEKNKNGIFIELLPNLVGMAEYKEGLEYGQNINVMIKKIDYDKKKVKLDYLD
jgi:small subunit ribosomal protein S1